MAMKTLCYWRRTDKPYAFPATSPDKIEVLTPPYGPICPQTGPADNDWQALECEQGGIDAALGLDGSLTECSLLTDALYVSVAVHRALGLPLDSDWEPLSPADVDPTCRDAYESLCRAVGIRFGSQAESDQRSAMNAVLQAE